MVVGIFICSPISAFYTLLGSTISTLTAMGLGASTYTLYQGLWGFSAVLSSIAIGGMFFVADSWALFRYAVIASAFTAVVHGSVVSFMAPFGLPGYTFPFNVVAWLFCLAGKQMSNLMPVEISKMSTPEEHIDRLKLCKKLTSIVKQELPNYP